MQKVITIKLVVIAIIGLFLMVPMGMILDMIWERNNYLNEAKEAVATSWTGKQKILGPIIVIPYEVEIEVESWDQKSATKTIKTHKQQKQKFLLPEILNVTAEITNNLRSKGIYKIPVYLSVLQFNGQIDNKYVQKEIETIRSLKEPVNIHTPYLLIGVSDTRGINAIPHLNWASSSIPFLPGSKFSGNNGGIHAFLPDLVSTKIPVLTFDFRLEMRGMEEISFVPIGQDVTVAVASEWPHPQFTGTFLPVDSVISDQGYQAEWKITSFASNIFDKVKRCQDGDCKVLYASHFGVKHIEAVDVYLQSERSVKYSLLFIGLSFVSFFIFEILRKLPIHPIQYTLVGFAIAVFYLMLFSLSEHLEFAAAYLIASVSCVVLMLFYLSYVLRGFKQASIFSVLLLFLYGVLYVIISEEDYALLMGAILTFITLAVVMVSTRNIDWYSATELTNKTKQESNEIESEN